LDLRRAATPAATMNEWMSLFVVVIAGVLGWLSGRLLPNLYGVALGWTVGITVLWVALYWSPSVRAIRTERKISLWSLLPSIWLFLFMSIALPAVLGTWATQVVHWPGFTFGLSIASALFLLVAFTAMRVNYDVTSRLLGEYADVHTLDSWPRLWKKWLELHLIGIVPLMLVEWIKFSLGGVIGDVAQILWFIWMFYRNTRVTARTKRHSTVQK
jgi:hypothetical protein